MLRWDKKRGGSKIAAPLLLCRLVSKAKNKKGYYHTSGCIKCSLCYKDSHTDMGLHTQ